MAGIIRFYEIPKRLVGASNKEIKKWARNKLNGIEPDLSKPDYTNIREGKIMEILLKPKKSGFFTPDGEFIQTYDYSPSIGDDLEKAEEKWDLQDKIANWINEENKRFNKKTTKENDHSILLLWHHGKRIVQFSEEIKKETKYISKILEREGGRYGYASMKHEYSILFYKWKNNLDDDDPVLSLTWKKVSHIIMADKNDDSVKEFILEYCIKEPLNKLNSSEFATLLTNDLSNTNFTEEDIKLIYKVRKQLKNKNKPNEKDLNNVVNIIKR